MERRSKKKVQDQAAADGLLIDPLDNLLIDAQNYDVRRIAAVYADNLGMRWWTKAWFNGRENGERSQEISRDMAVKSLSRWLLAARLWSKRGS